MKRLSFFLTAVICISSLCVFLSGCGAQNDQGTKTQTVTYADGSKYVGGFKEGLFDGQGTMTYPDGRLYIGQFKEGMKDGTGKMTYPDGKVEDGLWKGDRFVGASTSP